MTFQPEISDALRARLTALCAEGWTLWDRFDEEVRRHHFHPFVAAEYEAVVDALMQHRGPNLRFLEWGSATGVITIIADLLGFDAYGIELDRDLVATARDLARRFDSALSSSREVSCRRDMSGGPRTETDARARWERECPVTASSVTAWRTSTWSSDIRGTAKLRSCSTSWSDTAAPMRPSS